MDKINKGTLVDFLFPPPAFNHHKKLIIYDESTQIRMNQHYKNASSTAK